MESKKEKKQHQKEKLENGIREKTKDFVIDDKINMDYLNLWKTYGNELQRQLKPIYEKLKAIDKRFYYPIFYSNVSEEKYEILYIGINPSVGDDKFGFNKDDHEWKNNKNLDQEDIKKMVLLQELLMYNEDEGKNKVFPYFSPMRNIETELKEKFKKEVINWTHYDLFPIRVTNHKVIKELFKLEKGESKLSDKHLKNLYCKFIDIFWDQLEKIKPIVIVVVNAMASQVIKYEANKEKKLNEEYFQEQGFHTLKLDEDKVNVPILFSSMLTGAGTLDNGSMERLEWHIAKAYDWSLKNKK